VHDVRDFVLLDDAQNGGFVAQIHFFKNVFGMARNFFQIFQMAGISKAIQIDQPRDFRPVNDVMDQVRADEARAAGDKQIHIFNRSFNLETKRLTYISSIQIRAMIGLKIDFYTHSS
jgi:hypothetical protein